MVHIYSGIWLSHKIEENNANCSNMDGPRHDCTKWSKSGRKRHHMISCVESKIMIQMDLFTKQKQTHRYRKQTYGYQRGKGGSDKFGIGD